MQSKKLTFLLMIVGGWVGGYTPYLWGSTVFSFASIFLSAVGACVGIWFAFRLTR